MEAIEIRHAHMFCGLGGGKKGFNRGKARVGNVLAKPRCIGGIDSDRKAIAKFDQMGPGRPGTVLDLFSLEQYRAFHGKEPPAGWREATTADIHNALGNERPHIWFLSAPCKGFSGLLSETRSLSPKYQALNQLTLRGIWLALEAFKDDPVEVILFENVPRIATRGRHLLDQIVGLLRGYGYAVAETTHDCGELGGLAQSRKRFLLIARHQEKVKPFIYEPMKRPLRAVGEVLEKLPLPGDPAAGPMHRMPALQWQTWVRLAFVEAGKDWRSLERLEVENGVLKDYAIVPDWAMHSGVLGVNRWDEASGVVSAGARPTQGNFSIADPRVDGHWKSVQYGVLRWEESSGVVTSKMVAGGGAHSIADPRVETESGRRFNNVYRVVSWRDTSPAVTGGAASTSNAAAAVADPRTGYGADSHRNKLAVVPWSSSSRTVTGGTQVQGGALSVADPRNGRLGVVDWKDHAGTVQGDSLPSNGAFSVADPGKKDPHGGKYRVVGYGESSGAVIAASSTGNGAFAVADPKPALGKAKGRYQATQGYFGVLPWDESSKAVPGHASHDNGYWNVADPRLPAADERLVALIIAPDNTWHRPFTTLDLAALQSLVDPDELFTIDGKYSDTEWREHIGNAVPPDAAEAMAGVIYRALLGALVGETFTLSSAPVWVRPVAVALSVNIPGGNP